MKTIGIDKRTQELLYSLKENINKGELDLSYQNLNDNQFNEIILTILKENFKEIKQMKLNGNEIGINSINFLSQNIKHFLNLERLELECICLKPECIRELFVKNYKILNHLKFLNLRNTNINEFTSVTLAKGLKNYVQLEYLDLGENELTDKGIKEISLIFEKLTNLTYLNFEGTSITSKGMKYLSNNLKFVFKLEYLNIAFNNIGTEGFEYLSEALKSTKEIKKLILNRNSMSSLGLKAISSCFMHMTNLEFLNISDNNIGKEGCLPFAEKLFYLENLKGLIFDKNNIEDGMYIIMSNLYILKNLETVVINCI